MPILRHSEDRSRPAAAAVEFCLVAGVLFSLLLGMIEIGRAMMVLGSVSNAARAAARAGAVTSGGYDDIVATAKTALTAAAIKGTPQITVIVNEVEVTDQKEFAIAALPGTTISVKVGVKYSDVTWLPAGAGFFFKSGQKLSDTAVLVKEG